MRKKTNIVRIRLEPNKDDRVQLRPVGDVHWGAHTCDVELSKETLKDCLEKKQYIIGMGDMLECGLNNSVGDSVYTQTLNPQEQMEEMVELLRPLAEARLIIGLHSGNHCERIKKTTSIDIMAIMCDLLKVPYLGYTCFHYWQVGKQNYSAYSTHGSSGARLPYSKIKAVLDLFRYVDTEIALMGHMHTLQHMTALYYRVDRHTKGVVEANRHALITGSFLRYKNSYAEMMNLPPVQLGTALISLYGNEHKVFVSI